MRYVTRALYDDVQVGRDSDLVAWHNASGKYAEHFKKIEGQLPESAQSFPKGALHDATITSVERTAPNVLILLVDGRNCMEPFDRGVLEIAGIVQCELTQDAVGAMWLYEEWDVVGPGLFELSVLMNVTEFRIVAASIVLRCDGTIDCGSTSAT